MADTTSQISCLPVAPGVRETVTCTATCTNHGPVAAAAMTCTIVNVGNLPGSVVTGCNSLPLAAVGATITCTVSFVPIPGLNMVVAAGSGASNDTNRSPTCREQPQFGKHQRSPPGGRATGPGTADLDFAVGSARGAVARGVAATLQPTRLKSGARFSAKARNASAASGLCRRSAKTALSRSIVCLIWAASRIRRLVARNAPIGFSARVWATARALACKASGATRCRASPQSTAVLPSTGSPRANRLKARA